MNTILYILLILAFIVHDGEEIAVVHKWVMTHGNDLCEKHPMLRRVFNYLRKLNTKAFAIAAFEELIVLIGISAYAYIGGPYAIELWSAAFMVFSLHLIVCSALAFRFPRNATHLYNDQRVSTGDMDCSWCNLYGG